jgi:Meiotically Up-regulated Gene 113 (MUG113) protein
VNKEHILNEIRRTVAANGGKLLGERAFYRATGIKQPDWHGKFWARFSDAVKEAGFTPNEFPDEKQYSDGEMLEKYAMLSQALGNLPTNGDLRLKKRGDANFPNSKLYEIRFGSKVGLLSKLSTYCASRPEYRDVLGWCQDYITNNRQDLTSESSPGAETGFVYLIQMGKFFKIGRTNDFLRRGREIAIQLPEKAIMVHFFQTDDPSGIESYWHRRFSEKRREGEWFELNSKDVAAFKRRKTFM